MLRALTRPSTTTALFALLALAACHGGGGSGGGGGGATAPTSLSYSQPFAHYVKDVPIAPNSPTVSGNVSAWEVQPPLPAGLVLDPATGVLTGVPAQASPRSVHTVTASNALGQTSADLVLTVSNPGRFVAAVSRRDHTVGLYRPEASGPAVPLGFALLPASEDGAQGGVAHPSGSVLYTPNAASGNISVIGVDPASGMLTARAPVDAGVQPVAMALHPLAPFAYAIDRVSDELLAFAIDPSTLDLVPVGSPVATGTTPEALAIDPAGRFLYVANSGDSTVSTYALDASGLPAAAGAPVATATDPRALAIRLDGRFLYAAGYAFGRISIFALDRVSGLPSLAGQIIAGKAPGDLAIDPNGRFLFATDAGNGEVLPFAIDPADGMLAALAPLQVGEHPSGLAMDPTGARLFVSKSQDLDLGAYSIDASGGLQALGDVPTREGLSGVVLVPGDTPADPTPLYAYVANQGSGEISRYSIDADTGALTELVPSTPAGSTPLGLAADPFGRYLYAPDAASGEVASYRIDLANGALTPLGPSAAGSDPRAALVDPSGRILYVASFGSDEVRVLAIGAGGALAPAGSFPAGDGPAALDVDPTGRFLFVASSNQPGLASQAIDDASGALTPINSLAMPGIPRAVAVHPMLRVAYVALEASDVVVACDFDAMGTLGSVIGTFPAGATPVDLATDPLGRFLYAANLDPLGAGSVSVYQVNPATGLLDPGTPVLAGLNPAGATVEMSGGFAYVASESSNDVHGFSIEPMLGGLTPLGNVPAGMMPAAVTTVGTLR